MRRALRAEKAAEARGRTRRPREPPTGSSRSCCPRPPPSGCPWQGCRSERPRPRSSRTRFRNTRQNATRDNPPGTPQNSTDAGSSPFRHAAFMPRFPRPMQTKAASAHPNHAMPIHPKGSHYGPRIPTHECRILRPRLPGPRDRHRSAVSFFLENLTIYITAHINQCVDIRPSSRVICVTFFDNPAPKEADPTPTRVEPLSTGSTGPIGGRVRLEAPP